MRSVYARTTAARDLGIHRAADAGLPVRCTVARELPDDEHHVALRAQGALRATTA
ncbi:hypothetical protein ACFRLW_36855 [Streptomyces sp. NPDC056728]